MVDDKIFLTNRGESNPAVIAYALRITRIVRNELKIGAVEFCKLVKIVEREHTIDPEDFIVGDRTVRVARNCTVLQASMH